MRPMLLLLLLLQAATSSPRPQDDSSEDSTPLLDILEVPLNVVASLLKASNDTTPLLIEV